MARKSAVSKLPSSVRQELDRLIDDGGATIDELQRWLRQQVPDHVVSRSALGRYVQRRRARAKAADVVSDLVADDETQSETIDLMLELASMRIREARLLDRLRELGVY